MANNFDLQIKWLNGSQVEIQAGEGASLTGDEKVLIMQNDTPKETTTQAIADLGGGGGSSYLVYTALLNQSGVNAPVATVLQNTLGVEIDWQHESPGIYPGIAVGAFPLDKTFCMICGRDNLAYYYVAGAVDPDNCEVRSGFTVDQSEADDLMQNISIEIRVYP